MLLPRVLSRAALGFVAFLRVQGKYGVDYEEGDHDMHEDQEAPVFFVRFFGGFFWGLWFLFLGEGFGGGLLGGILLEGSLGWVG